MTNRNLLLEGYNSIEKIKKLSRNTFLQYGFPSNKNATYKYTNIKKHYANFFDNEDLILTDKKQFTISINELDDEYIITLSPSNKLGINNNTGISANQLNNDDIHIIDKLIYLDNPLSALNNAVSNSILIKLGHNIVKPIKIQYDKLNTSDYLMPNIIFEISPNSNTTFNIINENTADRHFLNSNIAFWVGYDAKVGCNILQSANLGIDIHNIAFYLTKNACLHFNNIITKGNLLRNNVLVRLDGENSSAYLNGLYYCTNTDHIDNSLVLEHLQPKTFSNQFYKGIVTDYGTGIFNGKIYVEKQAQKTNAFQLNKVLVTSKNAKARSKPDLEIHANDVKCSHGATIGNLDLDQLFYLRSRGLDARLAKTLIIEGFVNEIIEKFGDPMMEKYARKYLKKQNI